MKFIKDLFGRIAWYNLFPICMILLLVWAQFEFDLVVLNVLLAIMIVISPLFFEKRK